jgi:predicted outer membrane repeat protein
MATPSLFPQFMKATAGGGGGAINAEALTAIVALPSLAAVVTTPQIVSNVRDGQQIGVSVSVSTEEVVAVVGTSPITTTVE